MRYFIWLTIMLIGLYSFPINGQTEESLQVSAEQAILMDAETGEVLFEKQPFERTEIASITKIMTALVAIRYGHLQDDVTISRNAAFTSGSSIYLEKNEKMTLEELLYGGMLRSGNDAAVAIAVHVGGSEEGFVYLMNETADYIGMTDTYFMNAHGLDENNHYSTAYDMALLMKQAMKNDVFQKITAVESHLSKKRTYPWENKNKLLTSYYDACTGGKTGYTQTAGRTLVSTAEKSGRSFIAVTLDAPDDWNDHINMYESKFKQASKESSKEDNQTHSVNNLFLTEKELKSYKQLNVHEVDGKGSTFSQRYMFNLLKILRIDDNG